MRFMVMNTREKGDMLLVIGLFFWCPLLLCGGFFLRESAIAFLIPVILYLTLGGFWG